MIILIELSKLEEELRVLEDLYKSGQISREKYISRISEIKERFEAIKRKYSLEKGGKAEVKPRISQTELTYLNIIRKFPDILTPKIEGFLRVSFKKAAEVLGEQESEAMATLTRLESAGVLRKKRMMSLLKCPKCGNEGLVLTVRCPHCDSPNLYKRIILKHLPCGHVDFTENYMREGGSLVCPSCFRPIEDEYEKLGIFMCEECGRVSSLPLVKGFCTACQAEVDVRDSDIMPVFSFSIPSEIAKHIMPELSEFEFEKEFTERIEKHLKVARQRSDKSTEIRKLFKEILEKK